MIYQILIEAIVVGVSTVIMGSIVGYIISMLVNHNKTEGSNKNQEWNKYYVMEIALFLTGFLLHIFYEIAGLNKMYCQDIFPKTRNI
jgi:hypothetical protein